MVGYSTPKGTLADRNLRVRQELPSLPEGSYPPVFVCFFITKK